MPEQMLSGLIAISGLALTRLCCTSHRLDCADHLRPTLNAHSYVAHALGQPETPITDVLAVIRDVTVHSPNAPENLLGPASSSLHTVQTSPSFRHGMIVWSDSSFETPLAVMNMH